MSFQSIINKVKDFHIIYVRPYSEILTLISNPELRHSLMAEENDEYLEAAKKKDLTGIADALGDMLYILCGTIIEHGMQHVIEEVFDEIHRSNLSKLGPDGKPMYREDGKVLKGPNYFKPNLKEILDKHA